MKSKKIYSTIVFILWANLITQNAFAQKHDYLFTLKTNKDTAHFILFDEAPIHKKNFIKLVKSKFYDGLLFHRIIEEFMIQGGDPDSRNASLDKNLGSGDSKMDKIPFEFNEKHVHTKGAIAAARDNNPEKKSSASQFYIVQGKKYTDESLTAIAKRNKVNYTVRQRADYMAIGGTPFLDNNYTVFGTLIDSFDLVDKIAACAKSQSDRPLDNITMAIKVRKMRKKKITKKFGYQFL